MSYPEQIYGSVQICVGPTPSQPESSTFTGPFRKLYFAETTTITLVKTAGDTLTTNTKSPTGRETIQCFKNTAIEGITITEFQINRADQQYIAITGTVLAYS